MFLFWMHTVYRLEMEKILTESTDAAPQLVALYQWGPLSLRPKSDSRPTLSETIELVKIIGFISLRIGLKKGF